MFAPGFPGGQTPAHRTFVALNSVSTVNQFDDTALNLVGDADYIGKAVNRVELHRRGRRPRRVFLARKIVM